MNKTVTINISGIIFHIEEAAFDKLSKYLSTIKGYFSNADGGSEIMSDIEARIAEMLQSKTSTVKQVVLMSDVDYVMESMGKPEVFAADAQENNSNNNDYDAVDNNEPIKKRLYRDGDSKVLGGVCSGIGHYFGFDPVWLRIALALMLFFAGTGILLYIILWIAIPEAKTTAEKLAMKGEKADINNISKAVKEEAEQLKKRMEKYGAEFKNMASGNRDVPRNAVEKIADFIGDVFINIGRVLLKILGVFLVIIGVMLFFLLFTTVFGMSFATGNLEIKEWIDMVLLDGKDFYIGLIGIAIFVGTPVIMMIYGGVKILFKVKYSNRWLNLFAGIVWLIGFAMLLYVGIRTGQDFNKTAKVRENMTVVPKDVLILKMNEADINYSELQVSDEAEEGEEDFSVNRKHSNYMIGKHNDIKYLLGFARLNIIKSQTDKIELVVVKEANGSDKQIAKIRAQRISYNIVQHDSLLLFDNIFKVSDADKFRKQDITVILKLPVGKIVYLDKSLENLIYDIENITNTYDGDMLNRRWAMTENGLRCIDCDGIDDNSGKDVEDKSSIDDNSSKNGLMPKTPKTPKSPKIPKAPAGPKMAIKIDENGINIDSE